MLIQRQETAVVAERASAVGSTIESRCDFESNGFDVVVPDDLSEPFAINV